MNIRVSVFLGNGLSPQYLYAFETMSVSWKGSSFVYSVGYLWLKIYSGYYFIPDINYSQLSHLIYGYKVKILFECEFGRRMNQFHVKAFVSLTDVSITLMVNYLLVIFPSDGWAWIIHIVESRQISKIPESNLNCILCIGRNFLPFKTFSVPAATAIIKEGNWINKIGEI